MIRVNMKLNRVGMLVKIYMSQRRMSFTKHCLVGQRHIWIKSFVINVVAKMWAARR